MLLERKTAAIFGAGGAIGSTVARVLAREGASVYLSGRHLDSVTRVAEEIRRSGGTAEAAKVDALDEEAVDAHIDHVVHQTGAVDVVFNAMGVSLAGDGQVTLSTELRLESFVRFMTVVVASQFLTARAAARHMASRGTGVVVFLGATPARGVAPFIAGPSAAHAAIEGLTRCLATEWSPSGVRVVCVRPAGMTETPRIQEVFEGMGRAAGVPKAALLEAAREKTLLKRMPTLGETAEVVAFLASDRASTITGAIVNASCGEILD